MPDQVQATVAGGELVDLPPRDEGLAPRVANMTLGGDFTARVNMNVREDKHWSYGALGFFESDDPGAYYRVSTQIQPDKVGPAIAEIRREVRDILTTRPISDTEFKLTIGNWLRQRIGDFRTSGQVLGAVELIARNHWPDDFWDGTGDRLTALTVSDANAALRRHLHPDAWTWTIVGEAKTIRPQLDKLGLPVEVITPETVLAAH